ncbi:MAG: hypothetical protein ACQUYJ_05295 [Ferruginibacter sp.]
MKYLFSVLSIIFLLTAATLKGNAQQTTVVSPKLVAAPVAFAKLGNGIQWDAGPTISFSEDGQYLLGFTQREAKAWLMPEGELVYRFNTSMQKEDKSRGVLNYAVTGIKITPDGKYIYASGGSGQDFMMMPADLATGELLPDGLIKDSLKKGTYQLRRGIRNNADVSMQVMQSFWGQSSPLMIKRDKDGDFNDQLIIYGMVSSVAHPGELIICYTQSFCGSRSFIKNRLTESVKEIRSKQYNSNRCQFFDAHVARYNPATNTSVYLGNALKGAGGVDFMDHQLILSPSPVDDIVYVSGLKSKDNKPAYTTGPVGKPSFASFNTLDGKVLWEPATKLKGNFVFNGFNEFGNAVFKTVTDNTINSEVVFEPLTGNVLSTRTFLSPKPKVYYNAKWNINVAVTKTASEDWGVSIYNAGNGEYMLAVADQKGATEITAKTQGEMDRYYAFLAANRKALQEAYDRRLAEDARAAVAYQEKLSRDAAYHAAHFKTCPLCNGTGVWVVSGVAKAYRKSTYSEGRALDGSRTTIKSTESSTGGYWEQRSACLKCSGRGVVAR